MYDRWLFVVLFLTLFSTPDVCAQTQKEHVAIGIISTALMRLYLACSSPRF